MQDRNFRANGSGGPPPGPPASILIAEPEELLREALAAFCIPLVYGKSSMPLRLAAGLGLAVLDVAIWIALGAGSFLAAAAMGIQSFDAGAIPLYMALGIWPWILPAILWFRARRRGKP